MPEYDQQLRGFHRVFERELRAIVDELPLAAGLRVLDLACGDGFYTRLIAARVGPSWGVIGVDLNAGLRPQAGRSTLGPRSRLCSAKAPTERSRSPSIHSARHYGVVRTSPPSVPIHSTPPSSTTTCTLGSGSVTAGDVTRPSAPTW